MPETEQQPFELQGFSPIRRSREVAREFIVDHGPMLLALGAVAADAYVANQRYHIIPSILHVLSQAHDHFFRSLQNAGRPG